MHIQTQMVSIDSSQCSLSKHVVVLYEMINHRLIRSIRFNDFMSFENQKLF